MLRHASEEEADDGPAVGLGIPRGVSAVNSALG